MKKIARKIAIIALVIFILMQFYQPARNTDDGQLLPSHFTKQYNVPDSVNAILATSCYDCHSNNTKYPWYSYIQPARFFMETHIKNAKKDLNFSEFGNYSKRKQENKLERISKQVKSGDMPLPSYIVLHNDAKLNEQQKETLIRWIDSILKNNE